MGNQPQANAASFANRRAVGRGGSNAQTPQRGGAAIRGGIYYVLLFNLFYFLSVPRRALTITLSSVVSLPLLLNHTC